MYIGLPVTSREVLLGIHASIPVTNMQMLCKGLLATSIMHVGPHVPITNMQMLRIGLLSIQVIYIICLNSHSKYIDNIIMSNIHVIFLP